MEFGKGTMENLVIALGDTSKPNKQGILNTLMLLNISARFKRILRFGAAGVATTLFYFIVVNFFLLLTNVVPTLASTLAYILSLGMSYFLQSRFTFGVWIDTRWQVLKFLLTALFGLSVSYISMLVVTKLLHWPPYVGSAIICVLIPAVNYFVFRSWIFVQPLVYTSLDINQPHE